MGVLCFLFYPFFLSVFAGGSNRTRLPYLWRRRGSGVSGPAVWGCRCRRRRHAGECNLSADTLSVGNCTLGSLGACSLRVGDAFCGRCYDLMEVTRSLDGVSDGGAGSAVVGKVVVYY